MSISVGFYFSKSAMIILEPLGLYATITRQTCGAKTPTILTVAHNKSDLYKPRKIEITGNLKINSLPEDILDILGLINKQSYQLISTNNPNIFEFKKLNLGIGFGNIGKIPTMKPTIDTNIKAQKGLVNIKNPSLTEHLINMTSEKYNNLARNLTEIIYREYIDMIDPYRKRSKEFPLAHLYSINNGYYNNVPIEIIANPMNLQIQTLLENQTTGTTNLISEEQLYQTALLG